jgi:hypothetical protein
MGPSGVLLNHGHTGMTSNRTPRVTIMNFNLFSIIAASAVSASVALPAHASTETQAVSSKTPTYTQQYLRQSANFYAALDHKTAH